MLFALPEPRTTHQREQAETKRCECPGVLVTGCWQSWLARCRWRRAAAGHWQTRLLRGDSLLTRFRRRVCAAGCWQILLWRQFRSGVRQSIQPVNQHHSCALRRHFARQLGGNSPEANVSVARK